MRHDNRYKPGIGFESTKCAQALLLAWTLMISLSVFADDLSAGEEVYQRCMACHSLNSNRTGPKHCGLFGRKAGSVEGFDYTDAMRDSKIVWNRTTLDAFLESPFKIVPGTNMGYGGVWDAKDRANLVAYLQQASQSKKCD